MKSHDQIITELQAKIKYHYICISECNDRMNSIMKIKNLTCEQTNKQTGNKRLKQGKLVTRDCKGTLPKGWDNNVIEGNRID